MKICVEIHQPGLAQRLCEHFSGLDSQHFSDGEWYKFTKSGITKEKAILAVCEACHADVAEIVAFGDDYADIGMLKIICTDSLPADILGDFEHYQITKEIMDMANENAVLNPCPPFYRGEEVSEDVIDMDLGRRKTNGSICL